MAKTMVMEHPLIQHKIGIIRRKERKKPAPVKCRKIMVYWMYSGNSRYVMDSR